MTKKKIELELVLHHDGHSHWSLRGFSSSNLLDNYYSRKSGRDGFAEAAAHWGLDQLVWFERGEFDWVTYLKGKVRPFDRVCVVESVTK